MAHSPPGGDLSQKRHSQGAFLVGSCGPDGCNFVSARVDWIGEFMDRGAFARRVPALNQEITAAGGPRLLEEYSGRKGSK